MISLDSIYQRSPSWLQTLMLNAYAARLSRYRRGAPYRAAVASLLESQFWPRNQLDEYRDSRIKSIVRLAYQKSQYYREAMDSLGIQPSDIRGASDLPRLPLLTRETVRTHLRELLTASQPLKGWLHGHTSGTTGSPLSLWYDRETCVMNDAVDWRQKVWGGMTNRDWIGIFLGRVIVPTARSAPPFWRVNTIHRQVWFSSFHLSEGNLNHYVNEIRRRGLRFLEGYPSTMFILAQHVVNTGVSLPMQAVFTSSETLHQIQRETIEQAFGCRPFDFYGHAERTIFATECELHSGKHLAEEYGYTEVVNAAGLPVDDGTPGYLVGTSYHNAAMPMIRYRTGDISTIRTDRCECGRSLRRIESVATKAEDIVVTPDGRLVSPSILTHPFKPFPQILESQIIQDARNHILVKIVPSTEFSPAHQAQLLGEIARRLGSGMRIDVELVDAIPREPSGKFRWIISRVDHSTHFGWDPGEQ
jgi:phenylacetate-CoA ligase